MTMTAERRYALTREKLRFIYDRMTLTREFEERLKKLVDTGLPVGAVHYYSGEEAVAVGVCAALEDGDWITSTHRGHGHCIAKGVDVKPMMAELYGKVTGTNRGKGGSMHITDITVGMLGVNPILGMGTTHAIGAGLSARLLQNGRVTASFYGEGASSIGAVHESLNMASIWKLPIVFVVENNRYAQSTPVEYSIAVPDIAVRAAGYGMPGVVVDGQDALAVWEAADAAVKRARRGEGPTMIECKTYRYHGHASSDDPRRYRTAAEEEEARAHDCIMRFRQYALDETLLTAAELDEIETHNVSLIDEAIKFAETSPLPEEPDLYTDVYVPAKA
jgi:pyruvate dehydrogenase E1 component alpha subunit